MEVNYFEADFLQFFKELGANNNKAWMDENRKRYEKVIKDPFKSFTEDLIKVVAGFDEEVKHVEAKNCIFRINRDIRFSKDKTPYKTNCSALISPAGRKNKEVPGVYFEMGPETVRLYGGIYGLSTANLADLRYYLAGQQSTFTQLIQSPDFVQVFGEIHGEKSKRIPKDLVEAGEKQPLIYNKQWYFYKEYQPEEILEAGFMEKMVNDIKAFMPLTQFLRKGMNY